MKKADNRLFLLIFFLFGSSCFSQSPVLDSLSRELENSAHDSIRLRLYLAMGHECPDSLNLQYGEPALKLSEVLLSKKPSEKDRKKFMLQKASALNLIRIYYQVVKQDTAKTLAYQRQKLKVFAQIADTLMVVRTMNEIGNLHRRERNFPLAIECFQEAREYAIKMGSKKGEAISLKQMAWLYESQKEWQQALINFQKALTIHTELNDTMGIMNDHVAIASAFGELHDMKSSLEHFSVAMLYFESIKDSVEIRNLFNVRALAYQVNHDFSHAIADFEEALRLSAQWPDKTWIRGILANLSDTYFEMGNYQKALELAKRSEIAGRESGDSMQIAWPLYRISRSYFHIRNYRLAKAYSQRQYAILKNDHMNSGQAIDWAHLAARIDSATGDFRSAFSHYKLYLSLKDRIKSEEVIKTAAQEKLREDFERQKMIEKSTQEIKDVQARDEMQKQRIIRNSFVVGFLLILIIVVVIFRSYRQKQRSNVLLEKKNIEIEEKNRDITDSINYAKRIQHAKLPGIHEIRASLPSSFVLYKPKDIVSGDFYYFHKKNDTVFIAAADCTGHGVPGAFMSLIGFERLDDALINHSAPDKILAHLNRGIKASLKQKNTEDSTRDGLDIALCAINTDSREVHYAGANRPLWILKKGENEIEEVKATKKAIGGLTEDEQEFECHRFQLGPEDVIYICSDGYGDSFSGSNGKKLTSKKFKELLLKLNGLPMEEQERELDKFIEQWQSGIEQVDDILVIGIRL